MIYNVLYTLYIIQCILYIIHYTVGTAQLNVRNNSYKTTKSTPTNFILTVPYNIFEDLIKSIHIKSNNNVNTRQASLNVIMNNFVQKLLNKIKVKRCDQCSEICILTDMQVALLKCGHSNSVSVEMLSQLQCDSYHHIMFCSC